MSKIFSAALPLLCMVTPFCLATSSDNASQQGSPEHAFDKGCMLYSQYKFSKAEEWLTEAIEFGNQDAAYLQANLISLKTKTPGIPNQSQLHITDAASQGHLESMKFLYQKGEWLTNAERMQWKQQYYNALINLGAQDPAQAYLRLSKYHSNEDTALSDYQLQQAIKFDSSSASLVYASQIPPEKSKDIYLSEAEKGSVPAIRHMVALFEQEEQFDKALHWREENAKHGDLPSVASLGFIYQGNSERYSFVKQDLAKAHAYYITYLENAGSERFSQLRNTIDKNLKTVSSMLSKERLAYANTLAQSWASTQYYYHDALWENANCHTNY